MAAHTRVWWGRALMTLCLTGACSAGLALAAQTNSSTPSPALTAPGSNSVTETIPGKALPDPVTLEAIQQLREAAQAAAKQHDELLATRLNQIEQALADRREREFQAMQKANRTLLIGIAALVTVGLFGMALMAVLMFRSVHHLAEAAITGSPRSFLPGHPPHVLSESVAPFSDVSPALEASSSLMLNAIGLLEQRIGELEHTVTPPLTAGNGHTRKAENAIAEARKTSEVALNAGGSAPAHLIAPRAWDMADRFMLLLQKGQVHLNLEQAAAAIGCFDEAIALQPNHAEAHLKRGTALEKLERLDEALVCFDRALTLDPNLTTAFLCKGSVFNRLARYDEALRCYDEALRAGKSDATHGTPK